MYSDEARFAWENGYRVAVVHSFYSSRQPSGENMIVEQQVAALRRAGYSVELFAQRTDEREGSKLYPVEAAWAVATRKGPAPDLASYAPDVIHVHNTFPNYGKQWIKDAPAPVVATLHNYRPLCAAGTFYRDGKVCTDCADRKSSAPAVLHGCYRSRAASVPVALGQRFERDPLLTDASAIVALSEQMKTRYAAYGVPAGNIRVLPNFLPKTSDAGIGSGGDYWLYAGRLSDEKGILPLVESWPVGRKLVVAGKGDLEGSVRAAAQGKNVEVIGPVDRSKMSDLMRGAFGLAFPSRCLEGFPLVYLEAIAAGTPVLAWEPSVVASFVRSDGTGMVGGDSLPESLVAADQTFPKLREHCRAIYENNFTEDRWLTGMRNIYNGALYSRQAKSLFGR